MTTKNDAGATSWTDPDDAPEMTDDDFARADVYRSGQLARRGRGRPKAPEVREQIALRVEQAILQRYRDTGPGWQTRMNTALAMARENLLAVNELEKAIGFIETGDIVCREGPEFRDVSNVQIDRIRQWINDYRSANATLTGLIAEEAA